MKYKYKIERNLHGSRLLGTIFFWVVRFEKDNPFGRRDCGFARSRKSALEKINKAITHYEKLVASGSLMDEEGEINVGKNKKAVKKSAA